MRGERMRSLVEACYDTAVRLSPEDLALVRAEGRLPEWFFGAVEAKAREIKKMRRSSLRSRVGSASRRMTPNDSCRATDHAGSAKSPSPR
jgi:hypothetical protein